MCLLLLLFIKVVSSYIQPENISMNINDNVLIYSNTRYVWIPDDETGDVHMVDVSQAMKSYNDNCNGGDSNSYWLYTRAYYDDAENILYGRDDSLKKSKYNGDRPLVVITHGWNSYGNNKGCSRVRNAFLQNSDCNVIVLDWSFDAARKQYICTTKAILQVAAKLADFINWLYKKSGGSSNQLHMVGFGLGAHVVGIAGHVLRSQYKRVASRITGLDPTGTTFLIGKSLTRRDARYVEVIHTDNSRSFNKNPIGHADFYVNGGKSQPGCKYKRGCSHLRAYFLFAATLVQNNVLIGHKCENLRQATLNLCKGKTFPMGTSSLTKKGKGLYGLTTSAEWPYDFSDRLETPSESSRRPHDDSDGPSSIHILAQAWPERNEILKRIFRKKNSKNVTSFL